MEETIGIKVNGKKLAEKKYAKLKKRVMFLKKKHIVPTMAVIQVGKRKDSTSYIYQKKIASKKIGARTIVRNYPKSVLFQKIAETICQFNMDPSIHGIIIQRPLPSLLSTSAFNTAIDVKKDIDGFRVKSLYKPPVGLAVFELLKDIYHTQEITPLLKHKKIVIVGRGDTAGKPISDMFTKKKIPFIQTHSKTMNSAEFTKEADIIISCVGKANIINKSNIKKGAILISVGIHRTKDGKLVGDYDEEDIKTKAGFYTPTPGGIGPLTVAFLLSNLVESAEKLYQEKSKHL